MTVLTKPILTIPFALSIRENSGLSLVATDTLDAGVTKPRLAWHLGQCGLQTVDVRSNVTHLTDYYFVFFICLLAL